MKIFITIFLSVALIYLSGCESAPKVQYVYTQSQCPTMDISYYNKVPEKEYEAELTDDEKSVILNITDFIDILETSKLLRVNYENLIEDVIRQNDSIQELNTR